MDYRSVVERPEQLLKALFHPLLCIEGHDPFLCSLVWLPFRLLLLQKLHQLILKMLLLLLLLLLDHRELSMKMLPLLLLLLHLDHRELSMRMLPLLLLLLHLQ